MALPYTGVIKVRFADSDANGHVYFGSYAVLADEVSAEYWAELGWDFSTVQAQPALTFMVNSNIDYHSECLPGDFVEVSVGFNRLGNSSVTLAFDMTNQRTGERAASGTFTSVFVDKTTRRSCPVPEAFRRTLLARQPELAAQ